MKLTAYDTVKNLLAERGPMQLDDLTEAVGLSYVTTRQAVARLREEGEVVSEFHDRKTFHRLLGPGERERREFARRFALGEAWIGIDRAAGARPAHKKRGTPPCAPATV